MIQIRHVLCPVDLSDLSRRALAHAGAMARRYGAQVTVLHVVPNLAPIHVPSPLLDDAERARVDAGMRQLTAHLPGELVIDLRIQEAADVSREILAQAAAVPADLLVLGSHGRSGFSRVLLGSTAEKLVHRAVCPTMVVPPQGPDASPDEPVRFRRILCPVDFSDIARRAVAYALDLVEGDDAQVTLLHVIEVPPEWSELPLSSPIDVDRIRAAAAADALRRLRELVPRDALKSRRARTAAREGAAYGEILAQALEDRADLIVMGVRGRHAIDRMVFGSNTIRVLRASACPVLIIRE
jgi:nucleotide-binding universal stress UspA family protein